MTVNTEIIHNFVHLLSELLLYCGKKGSLKVGDVELPLWTQNRTQNGLPKAKFAVKCVWVRKIKNEDKQQNDNC